MKTKRLKTSKGLDFEPYFQLTRLSSLGESMSSPESESDRMYKIDHTNTPTMYERIIPVLIKYIKAKGLMPGDTLPSEKELCDIIGVGSRAMREALMILRSTGLLEAHTGKGWYIGKLDPTHCFRFLSPLMNYLPNAENFDQIINTRFTIEPTITGLTAKNITAEGLKELDQLMLKMREVDEKKIIIKPFDMQFHNIVAQYCGNSILMVMSSILIDLMDAMLDILGRMESHPVYKTHYPLYEAIKSGDQEKAEKESVIHIQNARDIIHRHLKSFETTTN